MSALSSVLSNVETALAAYNGSGVVRQFSRGEQVMCRVERPFIRAATWYAVTPLSEKLTAIRLACGGTLVIGAVAGGWLTRHGWGHLGPTVATIVRWAVCTWFALECDAARRRTRLAAVAAALIVLPFALVSLWAAHRGLWVPGLDARGADLVLATPYPTLAALTISVVVGGFLLAWLAIWMYARGVALALAGACRITTPAAQWLVARERKVIALVVFLCMLLLRVVEQFA